VEIHAKPGDRVSSGAPLLTLLSDEPDRFERALAALEGAVEISDPGTSYDPPPLILDRVTA
jgi:thymidine phosphorylase